MSKNTACTKVLLAKNEAGRAGYCEGCEVVELEIGPISLRVVAADLPIISQLIKEADANMAHYRLAKDYEQRQLAVGAGAVH
jgi:hypothetical protein